MRSCREKRDREGDEDLQGRQLDTAIHNRSIWSYITENHCAPRRKQCAPTYYHGGDMGGWAEHYFYQKNTSKTQARPLNNSKHKRDKYPKPKENTRHFETTPKARRSRAPSQL